MAVIQDRNSLVALEACAAKVYFTMLDLGLQPGAEDWVRNSECIQKLESEVKRVWVEDCDGVPSDWPWNTNTVIRKFIASRKKAEHQKQRIREQMEKGTLFPEPEGRIYGIRNGMGQVKIGYTDGDPAKRMKELQTGSADRLFLVGSIPGTVRQEKALHVRFHAYKTDGGTEWFFERDKLKDWIKETLCASN